jgi:hypothetical protein
MTTTTTTTRKTRTPAPAPEQAPQEPVAQETEEPEAQYLSKATLDSGNTLINW